VSIKVLSFRADYQKTKEAEASFYAKKKEAEGIQEMASAYGSLAQVMGGPAGLMQYLMLQNNTYEKLALANAKAINGLQPKITVWNTGKRKQSRTAPGLEPLLTMTLGASDGESASADSAAPLRNIMQALPPLLSTINDQTGIAPPSWLAQMSQTQQQAPMANGKKALS
jgi:flotillin